MTAPHAATPPPTDTALSWFGRRLRWEHHLCELRGELAGHGSDAPAPAADREQVA